MVTTGLEEIVENRFHLLEKKRLGLLMNPTAVNRKFSHGIDLLLQRGANIKMLFGPEHGLRGEAQDMVAVNDNRDPITGISVRSLYGTDEQSLTPSIEDMETLDAVVFDIQDVGSRYYTYAASMCMAMRKAAQLGKEMIVLDRPNPLGGLHFEGPGLEGDFHSFVGMFDVTVRHGMTVGELALLVKDQWALDVDLTVVKCKGWQRRAYFDQTLLPWVMPSPNMPTLDTAIVYPGACLIEGTNLSEGRGTTRPFELIGAPFIDGHLLATELSRHQLPGVVFRPVMFRPSFHKHAGHDCGGVQIHVVNRNLFAPFLTGVAILKEAMAVSEGAFAWRTEPYEFVSDKLAVDLLTGSSKVRKLLQVGASLDKLRQCWQEDENIFSNRRQKHLLYAE